MPGIQELLKNEQLGTIVGAITWGSCSYQEGTPDMFFYGIHGIEPLYALMGIGCETVTRIQTTDTDLISGNGRTGAWEPIVVRRNKAGLVRSLSAASNVKQQGGGTRNFARDRQFSRPQPLSAESRLKSCLHESATKESVERRTSVSPPVCAKAKGSGAKLAKYLSPLACAHPCRNALRDLLLERMFLTAFSLMLSEAGTRVWRTRRTLVHSKSFLHTSTQGTALWRSRR